MDTLAQTVLLFGEVLADIFPERKVLGGAPFNVARHLRAFGLNPLLISCIGHDALGDEVLTVMRNSAMDVSGIQRGPQYVATGQVRVYLENGSHRFEILPSQAYDFIDPSLAQAVSESCKPTMIYFGTLAQRQSISRTALHAILKNNSTARFLDLNLRMPWYTQEILAQSLLACNILKLNTDELATLAKTFGLTESQLAPLLKSLMERFAIDQIILTCGDEGAYQFSRDGSYVRAASKQLYTELVDSVGAGDAFSAVFILGEVKGWNVIQTLERANSFAAAICGIRGAVPESGQFYQAFIDKWALHSIEPIHDLDQGMQCKEK